MHVWFQSQLTAKRFIPHPLCEEPTARVYKTGDLARYLPDGNIEFLGRTDYQVKMQGHRIELGEIEATLRRHDGVGAAVVIVREETDHPKRLVAYVVPTHDADPTSTDLREFLKKELPPYMIPSTFVMLAALPLSAHGKVDRLKLPAARTERPDALATFVAPRNPTEQLLAQLCAQALQIDTVGIHDNLFELGGTSMICLEVVAKADEAGLLLTPEMLFARTARRLPRWQARRP